MELQTLCNQFRRESIPRGCCIKMGLDPDTYSWDGKAELEAERENENPNAAKKQKQAFDAKHLATLHIYKNAK
jgi:hypothetical protein